MWQRASADAIAVQDRFEWFTDMVSSALMPSAFTPEDAEGFYAEGAMLDLHDAQVSRFTFSPLRSRRTTALIRQGDPEQYQLALVTSGTASFAQLGREARLRAGDMVLWDTSRPYESISGMDGRGVGTLVLQVPKARMPLPSQQVDRLLVRRICSGSGMAAVLAQFLLSLAANGPDCPPQALPGLGSMAVELAASVLGQQLGSVREPSAPLRAHVLLRRIDAFIDHNLGDPELTPQVIADRHHISLRSLYTLFEGRPEGVAATIRTRRLERCRADLASPELRGRSIQAIAARWGFTDAASFSRAFRTAYRTTPSAYRRAPSAIG